MSQVVEFFVPPKSYFDDRPPDSLCSKLLKKNFRSSFLSGGISMFYLARYPIIWTGGDLFIIWQIPKVIGKQFVQ
jgi:hypothetical protein